MTEHEMTIEEFMDEPKTEVPKTPSLDEVQGNTPTPTPAEAPAEVPTPTPAEQPTEAPAMVAPVDIEIGELSDEERLDVTLKDEDKEKVFEIESVDMQEETLKRIIKSGEQPKPFNEDKPDSVGYQTRLRIKYKDSTYVSLIPSIRWYVNVIDGKTKIQPWFNLTIDEKDLNDNMTSTISKLYFRYCKHVGKEVGKVSQKEFIENLPGLKVKLEQWETKHKGKMSYRLDVKEFVA